MENSTERERFYSVSPHDRPIREPIEPTAEQIREVRALEYILDDKEYAVVSHTPRGTLIEVTIPYDRFYGTSRYKVLYRASKLFVSTLWRALI